MQAKSRVILEVKEVKPSTKKIQLKTNSHGEQSREESDAQLPNSKPRNFHAKWLNDGYGLKRKEESQNLNHLPLFML